MIGKIKFILFLILLGSGFFLTAPVFASSTSTTSTILAAPSATTTPVAPNLDSDKDGLKDNIEEKLGTDPNNNDTDGDGYKDGVEVANGFNPLKGNRNRKVERRVEVDLTKQKLYYFFNGVKIGTMPVSTGILRFATPVGEYKIMRKLPVHRYTGANYDYPNTKWNLEFKKGFYLHTAYWHNEFGKKPMSHGCVNMALKDVEKIYRFLDIGDKVKVYGKTPAGAVKIAAKE